MIKTDYFKTTNDGKVLVKTYSTTNMYIMKTNGKVEYLSAIDIGIWCDSTNSYKPLNCSYVETDIPIKREVEKNENNSH